MSQKLKHGIELLQQHYEKRLGDITVKQYQNRQGYKELIIFKSTAVKPGNEARILSHGKSTKHVIVLIHGLSDSPHYVSAIGKRFYQEGFNVIIPLLPAHGLKEPGLKMEDYELNKKWKAEVDTDVNAAKYFGDVISMGGFSTGGALSVNKLLRNPRTIKGALYLFSVALDLGLFIHGSSRMPFAQTIARYTDGDNYPGIGTNPYRYPNISTLSGIKLIEIVNELWSLVEGKKIPNPIFIAHSVHDARVDFNGIRTFLTQHVVKGRCLLISENVAHSELVLKNDIKLDLNQKHGVRKPPTPNPKFDWMMDNAIRFFKEEIK